jgi:hypothetical protein
MVSINRGVISRGSILLRMYPGKHDLGRSPVHEPPYRAEDQFKLKTSRPSTHKGNDTVGAGGVAPILNLQKTAIPVTQVHRRILGPIDPFT